MELSLFQSLFVGFLSAFAEILPVSARAHRLLLLKMFGLRGDNPLLGLFIHVAILAALHFSCRGHIVRMMRAQRLAAMPKRRRNRPLDIEGLMDFNLLKTSLIPVILAFLFYGRLESLSRELLYIAGFLALNGIMLYVPQYLPGSNKASGDMTRVEGLMLGLGTAAGTLPGISGMAGALAVASVRGMDLNKALNLALVMIIPLNIGFAVWDLIGLFSGSLGRLTFGMLLGAILAAAGAFVGVLLAIRVLRKLTERVGICVFGFYSWGMALLTFFLYLTAV